MTIPAKRRNTVRIQASILSLALIAGACSTTEQLPESNVATSVEVMEVALGSIEEYVTTTGTVAATQEADVTSEVEGLYTLQVNPRTGRLFAIGDAVKKGDVIVTLENEEEVNSISLDSKEIELRLSKSEYETQQKLYELGGVTERELIEAEQSVMTAQINYDNALLSLAKLNITAPIDGVIVELPYYTPGLNVSSGSSIVTIMNYKKLIMDINLAGKLLGRVLPGQVVRVSNYTIPDVVLEGTITQVSPVLDSEGRTFLATVMVDNDDQVIRPGMFVKAEVVVARNDDTIVIPKDIIITRRERQLVYVVERGTAVERALTTGLENPDEIEVLEGLAVDDRLVIEGYETLRNRAQVRITD